MTEQKLIIVCDDNQDNRDIFSAHLASENFAVETVKNGTECLELLAKESPDLLLLDIMMPQISGLQVLVEIRKQNLKRFPIVMITAVGEKEVIRTAVGLGANDYLVKPVTKTHLIQRMHEHLDHFSDETAIDLLKKANFSDDSKLTAGVKKLMELSKKQVFPMVNAEGKDVLLLIDAGLQARNLLKGDLSGIKKHCMIFAKKGYLFSLVWPNEVDCDPTLSLETMGKVNSHYLAEKTVDENMEVA